MTQKTLLTLFFKHLRKQPKLLQLTFFWLPSLFGLMLLFAGLGYVYETSFARPAMAYMGVPKTTDDWHNLTHTLRNDAYMVGYSETLANPIWVTYKVTRDKQKYGKRPRFETDWRTLSRVSYNDYRHSGYDRGHMAPNYVIASCYGRAAQQQTFLMSNITPQKPAFNQKIWQRLEEVSADHFSQAFPTFWVVTGPIFDAKPKTLKHTRIAIPKAFYKIFVRPGTTDNPPIALAFIMPQTAKPTDSLMKYVTTIDAVEQQTGIDFFWQLPDHIENRLEATKTPDAWQLPSFANLPSRY